MLENPIFKSTYYCWNLIIVSSRFKWDHRGFHVFDKNWLSPLAFVLSCRLLPLMAMPKKNYQHSMCMDISNRTLIQIQVLCCVKWWHNFHRNSLEAWKMNLSKVRSKCKWDRKDSFLYLNSVIIGYNAVRSRNISSLYYFLDIDVYLTIR